MLCNIEHNNDNSDPIDRKVLLHTAAYLTRKYSIDNGITKDLVFNLDNPVAFKSLLESMNNKEDILTQGQMLKAPDADEFKKAQEPELRGLLELDVFEYV